MGGFAGCAGHHHRGPRPGRQLALAGCGLPVATAHHTRCGQRGTARRPRDRTAARDGRRLQAGGPRRRDLADGRVGGPGHAGGCRRPLVGAGLPGWQPRHHRGADCGDACRRASRRPLPLPHPRPGDHVLDAVRKPLPSAQHGCAGRSRTSPCLGECGPGERRGRARRRGSPTWRRRDRRCLCHTLEWHSRLRSLLPGRAPPGRGEHWRDSRPHRRRRHLADRPPSDAAAGT